MIKYKYIFKFKKFNYKPFYKVVKLIIYTIINLFSKKKN